MCEHDRRTALGLVAGAGLASALILPACAQSSNSNESSNEKGEGGEGEVTANEDLMREHGVLRRILIVYRETAPKLVANSAGVDAAALANAATIFRPFGERYHEQLPVEQHIFRIVRKTVGEAGARSEERGLGKGGGITCRS